MPRLLSFLRRIMTFRLKIINIVLCVNAYDGRRDVSKEFCVGSYNNHRRGEYTEHWRHSRSTWSYRMIPATELTPSRILASLTSTALLQATSDEDSGRTFVFDAFNSIPKIVRFTCHYLVQMSRFLGPFLPVGWTRVKLALHVFLVADRCLPFGEFSRIFCNVSSRTNRMLAAGLAFLLFIQLTWPLRRTN